MSADGRRGSQSSDKALAYAVRDEKKLQFRQGGQIVAEGWLIGLDDYHYVVAISPGETRLVHKSCLVVSITPITLDIAFEHEKDSTTKKDIRSMAEPYRGWVITNLIPPRSAAS